MDLELSRLTDDYLKDTRYKLIDLTVKNEKSGKIIQIFVDSEEPVSLDDVAVISRELNKLLDERGGGSDISKLIVSSPGANKPFKYCWQLSKHKGRTLELELLSGDKLEAELVNTEGDVLTVKPVIKGKKKKEIKAAIEPIDIKFTDIKESRVKLKF